MLSAHIRNRNTLIRFVSLLLILIIVVDVVAINVQHKRVHERNVKHSSDKLMLASDFCVEALLKHDYVAVEQYLLAWAAEDKNTVSLQAVSANGFKILDYHRTGAATHTIETTHNEVNAGNPILMLKRVEDISQYYDDLFYDSVLLILGSFVIVSLFGLSLWVTLRHTAILPLQTEIEERIRAEKVLEKRTAELEVSNHEMEAFSYSVSHDLRAPLRSMDGFSKVLMEDYADKLDDEARGYLQRICDSAGRMGSLIDDMLALSRTSRAEIKRVRIDLHDIAEIISLQLQSAEPERSAHIEIEQDLVLFADKNLITIVLDNLMSNAWKYSSGNDDTRIKIGKMKIEGEKVFYCKDNGVGFDFRYVNKLFIPFQRLHVSGEFEGNGIGLATVQRVINRHEGRIWAESTPGEGATFYFVIPDSED